MGNARKAVAKTALRRKAEKVLSSKPKPSAKKVKTDQDALIHELEVHQIELEMQNDELRTTQRALEDSYRTVTDLYDYAPVSYLSVDRRGLILKANLTAAALLGYQKRFLTGKPFTTLVHQDDKDAFHLYLRSLRAGSSKSCEIRLYKKSRVSFDAQLVSVPFAQENGTGGVIHIAILDISERKRAEELARQRQAELENLYRNAPVGLCVLDRDLRFLRINDRMAEINGISAAAHIGKTVRELLPHIADVAEKGMRDVLATGKPKLDIEIVSETPAQPGIERSWMEHWLPVMDADDHVTGLSIVVEEITERKRAEEALRESERVLEQYAEELSITNKELESFSYSIAHDLRAPLRTMKGFSSVILEDYSDKMDDEHRRYYDRIIKSAETMDDLIGDMLSLSKISRQEMNLQPVDMSALAGAVVDELRHFEPQRNVQVSIAEGITARADERLMRIALINLLGNAWKYSARTLDARIEFGTMEKDGGIVYYIRDNGAGFDMEHAKNLFSLFKRLHSDSQFSGSGIGLAIVKRVIQRHQGKIWAESEKGNGATFYFTLAVSKQD